MKKVLQGIFVALIAAVVVGVAWRHTCAHPNNYLLSAGGDAIKNYFTPAWYVTYDEGMHFSGMLYPYGEHVVFTDDQPAITWVIQWVDAHIAPIAPYTIGILHILMLLSIWLGILFLYRILRYYQMPWWYAGIIAICIGIMAPQLERFSGHYALAYTMCIPVIWWGLIRCQENRFHWRSMLNIALIVVVFGLIHMYYTLIAAMFIGFYAIAVYIRDRTQWKLVVRALITAVIPVLCVMVFMRVTDGISDRPESPYGFFRYKASFQSVFLSQSHIVSDKISSTLQLRPGNMEGYAYVGLTGLLFLVVLLIVWIKRYAYKKSFVKTLVPMPGNMQPIIWSGIGMLLFSMALPFSLGLQFLLDWITPLKQFRSPGRFAWGFYYVYLISIAVLAWMLHKKIKKSYRYLSYLFIAAFTGLLMWDAGRYFQRMSSNLQQSGVENPFTQEHNHFTSLLEGTAYTAADFDALLYIPSFYMGSEKIYVDRSNGNAFHAMSAAYGLGLPLMDAMMSRSSFAQTCDAISLVSHPFMPIDTQSFAFTGFEKGKILLMAIPGQVITRGEKYILDHAELIREHEGFTIYVYDLAQIKRKGSDFAKATYLQERDSLRSYSDHGRTYIAPHRVEIYYYDGFEQSYLSQGEAFLGKRGFVNDQPDALVAEFDVTVPAPIWMEASVWCTTDPEEVAYPNLTMYLLDASGNTLGEYSINPTESTEVLGRWVRASIDLEVQPATTRIRVLSKHATPGTFDELMIRHTGWNAYRDIVSADSFVINNIPVGK